MGQRGCHPAIWGCRKLTGPSNHRLFRCTSLAPIPKIYNFSSTLQFSMVQCLFWKVHFGDDIFGSSLKKKNTLIKPNNLKLRPLHAIPFQQQKGMNLEKSFQNLPKLGGLVVTHPSGFLPPAENLHFGDGLSKADRSVFAFFQAWGPRHQNPRIPPYERDNLIWGVP